MKKKLLYTSLLVCWFLSVAKAQDAATTGNKLVRPNVVKLNLSAPILYSPAFLVSYERALSPHQSFSVEGGFVEFPSLFKGILPNIIFVGTGTKKGGFKLGADYRFYLAKENKYQAPHGLYLAAYISYYHFYSDRDLIVTDTAIAKGTLMLHAALNMPSIGGQLGYQFSLIHDHATIDLVLIGPSLTWYTAKLTLNGNINPNEENPYLQEIINFMLQNFPLLKNLVNNPTVSSNGRADLFAVGFRYSINVGFRF